MVPSVRQAEVMNKSKKPASGAGAQVPDSVEASGIYDAVVFGSGIAGLTCARRMALDGMRVAVLEKAQHIGGHLLPFERRGLTFEVGIHYISDTKPGSQWARACEKLEIAPEYIPLDDRFEEVRLSDGSVFHYRAPLEQFIADCKARFPEYGGALDRYQSTIEALWSLTTGDEFAMEPTAMASALVRSPQLRRVLSLVPQTTDTFIRKTLGIPRGPLYDILTLQHSLIAAPLDEVAALLQLMVTGYYFGGACFIKGGGRALIEMLTHPGVRYEQRIDARIVGLGSSEAGITDTERRELEDFGARFVVKAKGFRIFSRNVVWTPDPRLLDEATTEKLGYGLRMQLSKVKYPHPVGIGYFATKRELTEYGMENRNYWPLGTMPTEDVYGEKDLLRLVAEGPIYMSAGSLRDPLAIDPENKLGAKGLFQALFMCPEGFDAWGVADPRYYRVKEEAGGYYHAYSAIKAQVLKVLTKRMIGEFPALEGELVWKEIGTPLSQRRFLNSISGSGYGYAPTVLDMTLARPGFSTGVDGLWLCGAYTKPAHGIATAFISGLRLGEKLIKKARADS
ncbi:MAG: hypothetical protein DCC49_12245 [Acidobacteria bacterium]|nr:MAG: hypothetical protein DCC49_12245 [Acidobacteriota bacterium]